MSGKMQFALTTALDAPSALGAVPCSADRYTASMPFCVCVFCVLPATDGLRMMSGVLSISDVLITFLFQ